MKDGTVGKGYMKEGESVEKGKPIVEVVSEKNTYYSEASSSGIRRKVLVQAGVNVSVNAVIRVITASNETFLDAETRETVEPQSKMRVLKKELKSQHCSTNAWKVLSAKLQRNH